MERTVKIISTKKIEVIRDLAFVDRSPDLTKVGAIVSSDALIRVNVLKPVSYQFNEGTNVIPEPLTFTDPVTRLEVKESITKWKTVQHLVDAGVFEVYMSKDVVDLNKGEKKVSPKKPKSLADTAKEVK